MVVEIPVFSEEICQIQAFKVTLIGFIVAAETAVHTILTYHLPVKLIRSAC